MMKRMLAMLLLMCLLPLGALAAPVRDMENMDLVVDEPLQHMLNLVMSAAMLKDVPVLNANEQAPRDMDEAVFALFSYVESGADSVTLTENECKDLHSMFFYEGEFVMPAPEEVTCPCVTVENGTMTLDLTELNETPLAGAYVYDAALQEDVLTLKADLYTVWGYFSTPAEQVPETDLTWWAGAEIMLKADETSPYGYTLLSYHISEIYLDGLTSDWLFVENDICEYSVKLPSILGLADDAAENTVFQTADGTAQVTIHCTPASGTGYAQALADFKAANEGFLIEEEMDFFTFTAVKEGEFVLCVAHEALPYVYMLRMEFPAERQQEFTLYAEFIRNSMMVWGLNNG